MCNCSRIRSNTMICCAFARVKIKETETSSLAVFVYNVPSYFLSPKLGCMFALIYILMDNHMNTLWNIKTIAHGIQYTVQKIWCFNNKYGSIQ